jgi:hypothetical protein
VSEKEATVKQIVPILILLALATSGQAQTSAGQSGSEMRRLDFLLGAWEGEGWVSFGPDQRHTAKVREFAQAKAGGSVLLLEGLGKAKLEGKEEEVIVHNAFATVWYDREAKRFRIMAWRATDDSINADIKVGDKNLIWGFPDPRAGQIRFTIKLDEAGRWFEIGESSRDGMTWNKFFEMTLRHSDPK